MARIEMVPGWKEHVDREVHKFMEKLAGEVLTDMREHCPVDDGDLLADLASEVVGTTARIGAKSVPHAIYAEEGVGPHLILPNSKSALAWAGGHPVQEVHHPGYHGSHFMRKALYKQRGK